MNIHARISSTIVDLVITDHELGAFERATADLNIAESALGRADVQAQLRDLVAGIFADMPRAIEATRRFGSGRCELAPAGICHHQGLALRSAPLRPRARRARGLCGRAIVVLG